MKEARKELHGLLEEGHSRLDGQQGQRPWKYSIGVKWNEPEGKWWRMMLGYRINVSLGW